MKSSIFTQGLDKNPANYVAQSTLTFIERAALVYPQRPAVIHGSVTRTWSETYARCRHYQSAKLLSQLRRVEHNHYRSNFCGLRSCI